MESSDDEIVDYMVQRYGEFVLYRPRWGVDTAVLWLAPALFLVLAMLIVRGALKGKRDTGSIAAGSMSEADRDRLARLVEDDDKRE